MRTNKRAWGSVIIFKHSEYKRNDSSKSFSIEDVENQLDIEQIKELFEIIIDKSQKLNFEQIREHLNIL